MPPEQAQTEAAAAPAPQPTQAERMQAAIDKGKALSGVAETETKESNGTGETEGAAAVADAESGAESSGDNGEGAASTADAAEGAKPAPTEEEGKTKRAKAWADIERKQATVAKREREAARREEANTRDRAELQRAQQQIVELNHLFDTDPAAFIERFKGRPGGLRDLFERAVAQEKIEPGEARIQKLEKELAEEREWRRKREESEAKAKEEWDRQEAQRQERAQHQKNYNYLHEQIATLAGAGGYPNVANLFRTTKGKQWVCDDAYSKILAAWDNGKGDQRPIPSVLDDIEKELAVEAGSVPEAEPPARAAGAVQSAKPEARPKRTPPTLTSAQASARASAGRELTGDARKAHFASMLRTRPE